MVSTDFNKPENLVRDQGVGGSNPLSPTNKVNSLQAGVPDPLVLARCPGGGRRVKIGFTKQTRMQHHLQNHLQPDGNTLVV